MKNKSSGTLADKIAGILNTAPSSIDPEDEVDDATVAKVVEDDVEENEQEEILSKFRQKNIDLLADLDEKYAGKKTSRQNLRDSDSEDASLGSFDDEEEEEEEEEGEETKDSASEGEDEEGESAQENSEGPESEDSSEHDEDLSENYNTEGSFKHISDTNVSKQIKKGLCVRNQMAMWENLLEVRIQLQKCLLTANKMPQPEKFKEIKQSDADFSNKVNDTKNKLCDVLDKLLLLQKLLHIQYPETKNLDQKNTQSEKVEDPDDEEIPSDTDVEKSGGEEEEVVSDTRKKKRKLEFYESEISEKHKKYKDYRNNIIQKWNDKTRVVVKGGTTSHSILDQIEYNLSNKDKLIKKTQLKRSQYSILGEEEIEDKNSEEYNNEIFDDDDFYHQLLRELIEVKSADVSDPVQLSRQWIHLQNLRSKMKRKIDTRATKGRKIRYAVHSKLVNFMAPINGNLWTDDAKNELYSSLFGKNQTASNL